MAQLDVQQKKSNSWWLWLLIALIIIGILAYLLKGCNSKTTPVATADSTATQSDSTSAAKPVVAATQPDWNSVDFDAAKTTDADITDKDITVNGNNQYTIYTLGENILFATDQSTLQSSADQKLKQITTSLDKRFKGADIGIFGNTDTTGNTGHNKQLGAERAAAVKEWLVRNGALDSSKVSIHSFGAAKPVASNATAKGRQQNRNVQIVAFTGGTQSNR
jgi:outer membrane protein OmpA-like peptidoglycan-associated protein